MKFRKTKDKSRYDFLDAECIGRECWSPGHYQHRGATMSGSRNTGDVSACCMHRAYHGCPYEKPVFQIELAKERKAEGWKKA